MACILLMAQVVRQETKLMCVPKLSYVRYSKKVNSSAAPEKRHNGKLGARDIEMERGSRRLDCDKNIQDIPRNPNLKSREMRSTLTRPKHQSHNAHPMKPIRFAAQVNRNNGLQGMEIKFETHVEETPSNPNLKPQKLRTESVRPPITQKRIVSREHQFDSVSASKEADNNLLIAAAFSDGDIERGFQLLQQLANSGQMPQTEVMLSYWDYCYDNSREWLNNVTRMLSFISDNGILMSTTAINGLKILLDHYDVPMKDVKIDESGVCGNCQKLLTPSKLTKAEFETLKKAFKDELLNEAQQQSPKEFSYLHTLLRGNGAHDFIIDGMNVALSSSKSLLSIKERAKLIQWVIEYFVSQRKRVFFIGRKEMEAFPDECRQYINKHSTVFLLKNGSWDDRFLLYAALMSGQNTYILSRDMMRDHARQLNPIESGLFRRWQQHNQFSFVNASGHFKLVPAAKFSFHIRKTDGQWHIPCMEENDIRQNICAGPKNWVCMTL